MARLPAVAGKFYQQSEEALTKEVEKYIITDVKKRRVKGVISPHAGFIYSGKVAGAVYSQIEPSDTYVILGPNHTGLGEPKSILAAGEWKMPNGVVQIDTELAEKILSYSEQLKTDELSHQNEHSIEVQLPFIQYMSPEAAIVPITMASIDFGSCEEIGTAISKAIGNTQTRVTIVASTDMTHYESHTSASKKDKETIQHIINRDPEKLFTYVKEHRVSMCGVAPAATMITACNNLQASSAKLIAYMTSGETSGDYDYVVGYAGITIA